jgi:hypothetical protein
VSSERGSTAAVELHQAKLLKSNSLYAQGWRIVSIAQSTVGIGATTETIYLLSVQESNAMRKPTFRE